MGVSERRVLYTFTLGFGCMRAWALTFLGDSGVTPPMSLQLSSNMFYVFAPLMVLAMALVMAVVPKRWGEMRFLSPRGIGAAAAVLSAGSLLLVANPMPGSVVPEAICAVGFGCFLMQWGIASSRIPVDRLMLALGLGLVTAALLCFALCLLPPLFAHIMFVLFVPASAAGLIATARHVPVQAGELSAGSGSAAAKSRDAGNSASKRAPIAFAVASERRASDAAAARECDPKKPAGHGGALLRLALAMFLMELVARSSLMLSGEYFTGVLAYPSYSFELARLAGTALASVLLLLVMRLSSMPLKTLYMLVPVLLVSSCLFLLFENWGIPFVTYAIAFSAGAWLETVFWILFSHAGSRLHLPATTVWGTGRIAFWLSTFVGLMLWSAQGVAFPDGIAENTGAMTTITLVMALLSMVVYLFVLPEKIASSFGIAESADSEPAAMPRSIDDAAADIAKEFGLSKRETEVFALLAKGRDTAYIQEKLFISSGTVCSHRDRIYRKLDVHSRQELLDLVEERMG